MESKTQVKQLLETAKANKTTVAAVVIGVLAAVYFSNGGSFTNAISHALHPFDQEAQQAHAVLGYSNPAIAKQLEQGRQTLEAGLTTPTTFRVGQWGPVTEKDESVVKQVIRGEERPIRNYRSIVDVEATEVRITAQVVNQDGCGAFEVEHVLDGKFTTSKICLKEGETLSVPLKKSDYQLRRDARIAKEKADYAQREKQRAERRKLLKEGKISLSEYYKY